MNIEEAILMVRQEYQKAYRVAENPLLYALGRTHQKVFKEPINMTTISPAKITNADHIRSMSDEELAKYLEGVCAFDCHLCSEHWRLDNNPLLRGEKCDEKCVEHCLEWLQQPWEET